MSDADCSQDGVLLYTDQNTRVKNLPVRHLRDLGVGQMIEVEVLQMWSTTYQEPIGNGHLQYVTKEFHPGQIIIIDRSYTKPQ